MRHLAYTTIGTHRQQRRLWLEGRRLADSGFTPRNRYIARLDLEHRSIRLEVSPDGDRTVTGRQRPNRDEVPIVSICNDALTQAFGDKARARVMYLDGAIEITLHPHEQAAQKRAEKLERIRGGDPMRIGSLCTGAGILDHAIHAGLTDAGVQPESAFTVEREERYVDAQLEANPALRQVCTVHGSIDEMEAGLLPQIDLLAAGLPCTAASVAGRAKKGAGMPERDPDVGHLIFAFVEVVKATNPVAAIMENVLPYRNTASFVIAQTTLTKLGYSVRETTLFGPDFGSIERRARLCLVATHPTIDLSSVFDLQEFEAAPEALSDVLANLPPDDPAWRDTTYLALKEARDLAKGNNFKRPLIQPDQRQIGLMGRQYWKWRSAEPSIPHPTDPARTRLLTPEERARCMTIPTDLIAGLTRMTAHEVLGQSVIWKAFRAVAQRLGQAVLGMSVPLESKPKVQKPDAFADLPLFAAA